MGTVDFEFDFDALMMELGFEKIGIVIIELEMDFDTKICEFIIKIFLIVMILTL